MMTAVPLLRLREPLTVRRARVSAVLVPMVTAFLDDEPPATPDLF